MTLKWRLKELPDAAGIADLVSQKVITSEEARELLFNPVTTLKTKDSDLENKALKDQIKFLEGLVQTLINRTNHIWHYNYPVTPYRPYWNIQNPIYGAINQTPTGLSMSSSSLTNQLKVSN